MPAERKFSRDALRELRPAGMSAKEMAAHFGVATSTITRALRQLDGEDFLAAKVETDDRTTPPLPPLPGGQSGDRYDVYAGVLANVQLLEEQLKRDLSHQERARYVSQLRANQETLLRLQAMTVREDAAEILKADILAAMAEMDDDTRAKFESVLRRRRDLRRSAPVH